MIKFLVKKFIRDFDNTEDKTVREHYGILGGILGIICNIFLFAVKLAIGALMNSIAIISDAFNNLSDCGSSAVSIISAKMSNLKPDNEHPFGHGRIEYISSLIVSFIIMLVGVELFKSSFDKILNPQKVIFSLPLLIILLLSVLVKVWMFFYNRYLGKRINSGILLATATDSINDAVASCTIVVSTFLGVFTSLPLDGIFGIVVSILIIYSGFGIAKETIGALLGTAPSPELVKTLTDSVMEAEGVVGVHDLIVHDYGPGRVMASVHAEVPDDVDIVKVHEAIDHAEKQIFEKHGVYIVIHMDPISVHCERTNEIRAMITNIVKSIDPRLSIHDFRMTDGEQNINLIFDLVVPCDFKIMSQQELTGEITAKLKELDSRFSTVIQIDTAYNNVE